MQSVPGVEWMHERLLSFAAAHKSEYIGSSIYRPMRSTRALARSSFASRAPPPTSIPRCTTLRAERPDRDLGALSDTPATNASATAGTRQPPGHSPRPSGREGQIQDRTRVCSHHAVPGPEPKIEDPDLRPPRKMPPTGTRIRRVASRQRQKASGWSASLGRRRMGGNGVILNLKIA